MNLQGLSLAIQRSPEGVVPSLLFVNISDLVGRIVAKVESMQVSKLEERSEENASLSLLSLRTL